MAEKSKERAGAQGGIARLINAEKAANEIVDQAKAEAERILALARQQAEEIRSSLSGIQKESETARVRDEVEAEKKVLLQKARDKLAAMRSEAEAREGEVLQRLLDFLFGSPDQQGDDHRA